MSQDPKSKLQSSGYDFTSTIHADTYDFIKPEQFDLDGKVVLITGASKGIGRAVAASFAKAGASCICLAARSDLLPVEHEILEAAKKAERNPPTIKRLGLDVANPDSVSNAVSDIEQSIGKLDILINNAGYLPQFSPVADSNHEEWWQAYEVNVRGVYLMTRACLPLMLKDGMKTILNVSSIGGNGLLPGASAYQSGKLAVQRLTEFIDIEYGKQGVLTFSIHPGSLATELALNMPEAMHKVLIDTPELCGDAIVFYTAERRDWLAGRYVSVEWDMEQLFQKKEKIIQDDLLKVRLAVGID